MGIVTSFVSPVAKRCRSDGFVRLVSRHPAGVSVSTTRSVSKIARRSWLATRKTTLLDDPGTPLGTTVSVTAYAPLTPGVSYEVWLAGHNSRGDGPESARVTFTA